MIDHISLRVRDLAMAKTFYVQALAPIGYQVVMEFPEAFGMGVKGKPDFWVTSGGREGATTHVAFRIDENAKVDAFHSAAIAAGGLDNGAPGLRHEYHPSYYGAFVNDPEGNNIEVVCHGEMFKEKSSRPAAKRATKSKAKAKKPAQAKIKTKTKKKAPGKKKRR